MNAQEIFDTVAKHLLTQNAKSATVSEISGLSCWYRSPGGLKCAAGALIPDSAYDPCMEGKRIDTLVFTTPALVHLQPHSGLLQALQGVHDLSGPDEWRGNLSDVARNYSLDEGVLQ